MINSLTEEKIGENRRRQEEIEGDKRRQEETKGDDDLQWFDWLV